MVAYSFQERFCQKVVDCEKRQTIRADRRRHARPGESLQLYFGMRTKQCRKLISPDPICVSVDPIRILVPTDGSGCKVATFNLIEPTLVSDRFAQLDGFDDAKDFSAFWLKVHGAGLFTGVLIRWGRWGAPR